MDDGHADADFRLPTSYVRILELHSELAQLARVTQPRMTQIMNLTFLAPDIQEEILFLDGDTVVSEKALRPITVEPSWTMQRRMWREY